MMAPHLPLPAFSNGLRVVAGGTVLIHDQPAGLLAELETGATIFQYHPDYAARPGSVALSINLPLRPDAFETESGLHPYFDNLLAEGWLARAQLQALGLDHDRRARRLLAFGYDLIGAVSIVEPYPQELRLDFADPELRAALLHRASAGGLQPKLLVIERTKGQFAPAALGERSTHIAKLATPERPHIVDLEVATSLALSILLPHDEIVEITHATIKGHEARGAACIVRRFDRQPLIRFEEVVQVLGRPGSEAGKYRGSYADIAEALRRAGAGTGEISRAWRRLIAGLLLGNTDQHLKNWGIFTGPGARLTPAYDQVCLKTWRFDDLNLEFGGQSHAKVTQLKAKHILASGRQFGLPDSLAHRFIADMLGRIDAALSAVSAQVAAGRLHPAVEAPLNRSVQTLRPELVSCLRKKTS